ncbi:MAG: hypothetical protein AB7I04_21195 [Pseudomonadales bacterium]
MNHTYSMVLALITLAWLLPASEAHAASTPRTAVPTVTSTPKLATTAELTIATGYDGTVRVRTPTESFVCESTCTRRLRSGTEVVLEAQSLAGASFDSWINCTGRIEGSRCRMTIPSNTLRIGVGAVFVGLFDNLKEIQDEVCAQLSDLCDFESPLRLEQPDLPPR